MNRTRPADGRLDLRRDMSRWGSRQQLGRALPSALQKVRATGVGPLLRCRTITDEGIDVIGFHPAERGLNVGHGWPGLIDDDLDAGHLVVTDLEHVDPRQGYWVSTLRGGEDAETFRAWLLQATRNLR